jgi:hypothetical protein
MELKTMALEEFCRTLRMTRKWGVKLEKWKMFSLRWRHQEKGGHLVYTSVYTV